MKKIQAVLHHEGQKNTEYPTTDITQRVNSLKGSQANPGIGCISITAMFVGLYDFSNGISSLYDVASAW